MRTMISCTILSAALLGGTACTKSDTDAMNDHVEKAKDTAETQARRARDKAREAYDKYSPEVKHDLAEARDEFVAGMKVQFAKLEQRIDALESRGDSSSKATAAKLRARRDELASRLDSASHESDSQWEKTKAQVRAAYDRLKEELDSATR